MVYVPRHLPEVRCWVLERGPPGGAGVVAALAVLPAAAEAAAWARVRRGPVDWGTKAAAPGAWQWPGGPAAAPPAGAPARTEVGVGNGAAWGPWYDSRSQLRRGPRGYPGHTTRSSHTLHHHKGTSTLMCKEGGGLHHNNMPPGGGGPPPPPPPPPPGRAPGGQGGGGGGLPGAGAGAAVPGAAAAAAGTGTTALPLPGRRRCAGLVPSKTC